MGAVFGGRVRGGGFNVLAVDGPLKRWAAVDYVAVGDGSNARSGLPLGNS